MRRTRTALLAAILMVASAIPAAAPALAATDADVHHDNWNQFDCYEGFYSWGRLEVCWVDRGVFQIVHTPSGNTIEGYDYSTDYEYTWYYDNGRIDSVRATRDGSSRVVLKDGDTQVVRIVDGYDQVESRYGECSFFTRSREFKEVNGTILMDFLIQDSGTCS